VGIRARTIRGSSGVSRYSDNLQEIALSSRPVDVDIAFEKPVAFSLSFDGTVAPIGLSGSIRQMALTGSASIEPAVDRVTSDTDLGATGACVTLMQSDVDVYRIAKLMTAGLLGRNRHFVPTRWAITAVDDTLAVQMKKEIAAFPPLEEIRLFSAELFGSSDRLHPCSRGLEIRNDREMGETYPLGGRSGYHRAGPRRDEKEGLFSDFRCILFGPACCLRVPDTCMPVSPGLSLSGASQVITGRRWAPG
jgi:hypothetical protein